jgi:hypothetical protein
MERKLLTATIVLIILASCFVFFSPKNSVASQVSGSQLKIYVGPASVLADGNTYTCVFVQLLDSNGEPFRALQDTTISLTSSSTNVGTIEPTITISKGSTFASADFTTTFTPGATTISASATGYATVQAVMTTIGPIPSALAVYGFPSTLPADGGNYSAIMVQLQDSTGLPARAPQGGVQVALTCSDTINVGKVSSSVTIPAGQTYAIANFTTVPASQQESATVTAISGGYASGQTTITTTPLGLGATQLKILVGPTQIPADNSQYSQIAVELQNAQGNVVAAPSSIQVDMSSSDQTIGQINSTITISKSQTYAVATFNTTYKAGTATITATANNTQTASQQITTVGFTPSQLAVYCIPSTLPADNGSYQAVIVQLQDSEGRPAKDPNSEVNINLFSSKPDVGNVGNSELTIPFGSTLAIGTLETTNSPGTTTITAQAPGYSTGQGTFTTYIIDYSTLTVSLKSNASSVTSGNTALLTATVTVNSNPITGATVTFTSNSGGTFTATSEQGNGEYQTNFTAPNFSQSTTCTITATASKAGAYISSQGTTGITVLPAPAPTPTPSPTPSLTPTPTPTPTASAKGTLTLRTLDKNNQPLSGTLVSSTTQPKGATALMDITNSTGYVTFNNVTAGSYTFEFEKDGYPTTNATLNFPGKTMTMPINLIGGSITQANGFSITLIILIVVVIAICCVTVFFFIKSGSQTRAKKIRELQKQLNTKV